MKRLTNLQHAESPALARERPFGKEQRFVIGLDLEWTKNYRIKNGNQVFCYSLTFVPLPQSPNSLAQGLQRVGFRSVYTEQTSEMPTLLQELDADLAPLMGDGNLFAGHQLCSDLAVALACAQSRLENVELLREAWRSRSDAITSPRVIDTRFDMGEHLPGLKSRRLVDVCNFLKLGVEQPELRGSSMTAMHRKFLETGDERFYEKLAILNLRHGLSTAVLALIAVGLAKPEALDINPVISEHLWDLCEYVASPQFPH